MSDSKWLLSLKAGDEVAVASGYTGTHYRLEQVVKVTRTQIVLSNDRRFRRDNGWKLGQHGYDRSQIVEPTQKVMLAIRRAEALHYLQNFNWSTLKLAQLEVIVEMIKKNE